MKPLTVVVPYTPDPFFEKTLILLAESDSVEQVVVISQDPVQLKTEKCRVLVAGPLPSGETLRLILTGIQTKYLLLLPGAQQILIEPESLNTFVEAAESVQAGIVYSDFYDEGEPRKGPSSTE